MLSNLGHVQLTRGKKSQRGADEKKITFKGIPVDATKGLCIDSSCSLIYCCILFLRDAKEESNVLYLQTCRHRFKLERKESRERGQQNSIIVNANGQVKTARLFEHPNTVHLCTKRSRFFLQLRKTSSTSVRMKLFTNP